MPSRDLAGSVSPGEVLECGACGGVRGHNNDVIDECLGAEIEWLNSLGVKTKNSCCGHGDPDSAYIQFHIDYADLMADLEYEVSAHTWGNVFVRGARPMTRALWPEKS